MDADESPSTLYDRLGGEQTVARLVDELYERVLSDDVLRPFFRQTPMDSLRRMQREFIAAALGGPIVYAGRPLREAHGGRGIDKNHFRRYIDHLMAALERDAISPDDSYDIISRLNTYVDEVTGDTNVDG